MSKVILICFAGAEPEQGRGGSIRSALRRRRAKNNWLRLVTTMRNVDIADCENLFIKDEYRHIVFDENDLLAVINDEYVVKTPTIDENEATPNKRVTWRESLEETFYDTDDECVIVDLPSSKFEFSENSVKNPPRRQITRQFSVEDPGTSPRRPSAHYVLRSGCVATNVSRKVVPPRTTDRHLERLNRFLAKGQ